MVVLIEDLKAVLNDTQQHKPPWTPVVVILVITVMVHNLQEVDVLLLLILSQIMLPPKNVEMVVVKHLMFVLLELNPENVNLQPFNTRDKQVDFLIKLIVNLLVVVRMVITVTRKPVPTLKIVMELLTKMLFQLQLELLNGRLDYKMPKMLVNLLVAKVSQHSIVFKMPTAQELVLKLLVVEGHTLHYKSVKMLVVKVLGYVMVRRLIRQELVLLLTFHIQDRVVDMRIKPTAKHPDVVMMDGIVGIWLEEELLVFKMRINLLLNLLTKLNVGPVVVKVIHGLVIEVVEVLTKVVLFVELIFQAENQAQVNLLLRLRPLLRVVEILVSSVILLYLTAMIDVQESMTFHSKVLNQSVIKEMLLNIRLRLIVTQGVVKTVIGSVLQMPEEALLVVKNMMVLPKQDKIHLILAHKQSVKHLVVVILDGHVILMLLTWQIDARLSKMFQSLVPNQMVIKDLLLNIVQNKNVKAIAKFPLGNVSILKMPERQMVAVN
tara:strand:- start:58 stop:1533 length:1476 start_codon:yes stop_codon:yes gene_type:complete